MNLISIFLLPLQVQVIHVSSFTAHNQISHINILSEYQRHRDSIQHSMATLVSTRQLRRQRHRHLFHASSTSDESAEDSNEEENESPKRVSTYDLGVGKNLPVGSSVNSDVDVSDKNIVQSTEDNDKENIHWNVPDYPNSKTAKESLTKSIVSTYDLGVGKNSPVGDDDIDSKTVNESLTKSITDTYSSENNEPRRVRRMVAHSEESSTLRGAIWHEEHYSVDEKREEETTPRSNSMFSPSLIASNTGELENSNGSSPPMNREDQEGPFKRPDLFYPNIDLSIPPSVYNPETSTDIVWDLMRWEAYQEAQREPLLVSFLYSSILNHDSLESSLAFLLANKLSSAAMISTQVQSLILDALDKDRSIGRSIRADIMVSKQMISCQQCS